MEQTAALRAEWFARLADAIDGAQRVAWQLRTCEGASKEARELYDRLEAAKVELDLLRGASARTPEAPDPSWLEKLGWGSTLLDPAGYTP